MCEAGYRTEYKDNYSWDNYNLADNAATLAGPGLLKPQSASYSQQQGSRHPTLGAGAPNFRSSTLGNQPGGAIIDNTEFYSEQYPSIWRETIVRKDDRGTYIDPFKDVVSKPYGRRLMYDATHPQMMYGSQWSSNSLMPMAAIPSQPLLVCNRKCHGPRT